MDANLETVELSHRDVALIDGGAEVVGRDSMAGDVTKDAVPEMRTCTDPYEAAHGATAS